MKSRWNGACAALMLSICALAHAQGAPVTPVAGQADPAQQAVTVTDNGPLTRAQVYEQLVQAERDGQLKMLNQTVYAHH